MIKVENEIINFDTFPDGSILIKYNPTYKKIKKAQSELEVIEKRLKNLKILGEEI